jgi:hypothetical protein
VAAALLLQSSKDVQRVLKRDRFHSSRAQVVNRYSSINGASLVLLTFLTRARSNTVTVVRSVCVCVHEELYQFDVALFASFYLALPHPEFSLLSFLTIVAAFLLPPD